MTRSNGDTYRGYMRNDLFDGRGKLIFARGN